MKTIAHAKVTKGGRILIPAEFRKELGIQEGDKVVLRINDGQLQVLTQKAAIKAAQAVVRQYVKEGESLADELIRERRQQAALE